MRKVKNHQNCHFDQKFGSGDFDLSDFSRMFGQGCSKFILQVKIASPDLKSAPTYPGWWFMMIGASFKNSSKMTILLIFPFVGTHKAKNPKNHDFSWFFKICSNDQKSSPKVSRSWFKVWRSYFCPLIAFLSTSGQIIGHNAKSQKSPKLPFWPKIRFSIKWVKLLNMMLYGRKWIPRVF